MKVILNTVLIFVFSLITLSCEKVKEGSENQIIEIENETPKILKDGQDEIYLRGSKRRKGGDIVENLYKELIDKDDELRQLNTKINKTFKNQEENIENYGTYSSTNERYWSKVDSYVGQINDTTYKKELKELFLKLKEQHNTNLEKHNEILDRLYEKNKILNDHLIVMKLLLTIDQMKNYQKNELPKIEPFEISINDYDEVIKETKERIKLAK